MTTGRINQVASLKAAPELVQTNQAEMGSKQQYEQNKHLLRKDKHHNASPFSVFVPIPPR